MFKIRGYTREILSVRQTTDKVVVDVQALRDRVADPYVARVAR